MYMYMYVEISAGGGCTKEMDRNRGEYGIVCVYMTPSGVEVGLVMSIYVWHEYEFGEYRLVFLGGVFTC